MKTDYRSEVNYCVSLTHFTIKSCNWFLWFEW